MAMQIANNYSSYVAQNMVVSSATESTKKKETENTTKATESSKAKNTSDYVNKLAKLVPSVEFRVGNACVSDKSGKSLTVNPKLWKKCRTIPKKRRI